MVASSNPSSNPVRVIALLLLLLLGISAARAQMFPSGNAQSELLSNQGSGNQAVSGLLLDGATWAPSLAQVTREEKRFFRTFRVGMIRDTARVDYGGDGAVLIGIEMNVLKGATGKRINSLRPIYLSGGKKFFGDTIGSTKGQIERLVARDGYAIQNIVFSDDSTLGIKGVSVTFAAILPNGMLDKSQTYSPPSVGAGGGTMLGLENIPFSGIYAAPGEQGAPITAAAMLVSQNFIRQNAPALLPRAAGTPSPNPDVIRSTREVIIVKEHVVTHLDPSFADFIRANSDKIFFVEGSAGKGSAFTCKLHGKPFLLTNQHVVAGNPNVKFAGLTRGELNVGDAIAASGHDVMAYSVAAETPAFELIEDLTRDVTVGDVVAVLGDAEGAGVVRPIGGRVAGIGPNLIEVSAEFLPGNSGSPIIHLKTGRVIGIATYASAKPVALDNLGNVDIQVRRFGYRLDSIKKWQQVQWPAYQSEVAAVIEATGLSQVFLDLGKNVITGTFRLSTPDPRLRTAYSIFPLSSASTVSPQQQASIRDEFIKRLRRISAQDIAERRARIRYDYLRDSLAEEEALREMIIEAISAKKEMLTFPAPTRK